jgi:hypothetical protein
MLEKWKRAVVHLECATDSEHFYDRIKRIDEQRALLDQGKIMHEQFAEEISSRSRDVRFHGTALFLSHAGRRYLLTARHVVWDELSAKRELEEEQQRVLSWPDPAHQQILQSAIERAHNNIFNIIFRVPTIDEVLAKQEDRKFLMNLGAGTPSTAPYTFSAPELDLALISLDQRDSRFADGLVSSGFVPVESSDIADGPDAEGQEVFTIGFPSATALLGQISQHPASADWSTSHFSLPVSSFGRVSMLHNALPFYWADMSIYPGNSGGPVVANDRLVGVVSAQATLPIDGVPDVRTRIPFGLIIKTSFVRTLLDAQAQKDC